MTLRERIAAAHKVVEDNPSQDEDALLLTTFVEWLRDQKYGLGGFANATIDTLLEDAIL